MPGGARVFVDTNVLLYIHDRKNPDKRKQALAWVSYLTARDCARLNLQVLNELTYVLLRKK
jgi:predicted nucleic acid-binding protein